MQTQKPLSSSDGHPVSLYLELWNLALILLEALRGGKRLPKDVETAVMTSGLLLLMVSAKPSALGRTWAA